MEKLRDKRVLVTGASSGIGKAMALRAAQDGAHVILAARNEEKLNMVKDEVETLGGTATVVPTDVTSTEQIRNLFLKATENNAHIDFVFNNAGMGYVGKITEITVEQVEKMMAVNATGMIMVAKFASEVLARQKHGHMVMTSSLAGLVSLPEWSVYAATKWAITGFAGSIRQELKKEGVYVSTLHPGLVKTNFFAKENADLDLEKLSEDNEAVEPSDVAQAVYDALFTDQQRILIPKMSKQFAFLYKYLPNLTEKLLEKMTESTHPEGLPEDEPDFSYVKPV